MAKLVEGGYGHHPSGKLYAYYAGDNVRVGQNVVAPVTNKKTGKTYNTMFTIMRTSNSDSDWSKREVSNLKNANINLKTIKGNEVLSLSGGKPFSSARKWKIYSNYVYSQKVKQRLTGQKVNILSPEEYFESIKQPPKPRVKKEKGVKLKNFVGRFNIRGNSAPIVNTKLPTITSKPHIVKHKKDDFDKFIRRSMLQNKNQDGINIIKRNQLLSY